MAAPTPIKAIVLSILPVDTFVERIQLDALVPDQTAIAIAAMAQLEETQQLERQWTLRCSRPRV